VALSFQLDMNGSAASIHFQQTGDHTVAASAIDALRAASPFDPMTHRVRCLANRPLTARFENPTIISD
jgi:hypothetical protein